MAIRLDLQVIPQPQLEFGGSAAYADPKEGLRQTGPFSIRFGSAHRAQVRVGLVGPRAMTEMAERWFERCRGPIPSGQVNVAMYPDFPGFEKVFRASLDLSPRWRSIISASRLDKALEGSPHQRFKDVLDLYAAGLRQLSEGEFRPDVVVCCLPPEVLERCRSVTKTQVPLAAKKLAKEREELRSRGQLSFFNEWQIEETAEDLLYRDFRRGLKAAAMRCRIPIQIATDKLLTDGESNQDPATRAWNVGVAMFYKAGGLPWRIRTNGPEACFVGVSFHHLRTSSRHLVYSSLAQAFSTDGDGFALRGEAVSWDPAMGRHPHLSERQAGQLAVDVLREYSGRTGRMPARVVIHKTSKFEPAECVGLRAALGKIPIVELVTIAPTNFRLVLYGAYPPKRGTLCRVNDASAYLFTTGFMPEWRTYPGAHIPAPFEIISDREGDVVRCAQDILALTRMNWNTARDTSGQPVTIRFAREVGGIMAEYGLDSQPSPSYRYYM